MTIKNIWGSVDTSGNQFKLDRIINNSFKLSAENHNNGMNIVLSSNMTREQFIELRDAMTRALDEDV